MDSCSDDEPELPVWYNGHQKWITGLSKRTTCDDVIYAVLGDHCTQHGHRVDVSEFAIWERWRGVERQLKGRTRVMKLWNTWGAMTDHVQLVIKRLESIVDSSSEVSSRRVRRKGSRSEALRNKRLSEIMTPEFSDDRKSYLVKVVTERSGLIKRQEERMLSLDKDIRKHEDRIHQLRMQRKGKDYVQNAYMRERTGDESTSTASSNDDYQMTEYTKQLEAYLELCSKVLATQEHLEKQQQRALELSQQITDESSIEEIRKNIRAADELHTDQENEISKLNVSIKECDETIQYQETVLRDLNGETLAEEPDSLVPTARDRSIKERAMRTVEEYEPYMTYMTYYRRKEEEVNLKNNAADDSNSDTGLSSLHSDETPPILETLV